MHHYGEDAVEAVVSQRAFVIHLGNHATGAIITITGPRIGVFEDPDRPLSESETMHLGREMAHFLRQVTEGM